MPNGKFNRRIQSSNQSCGGLKKIGKKDLDKIVLNYFKWASGKNLTKEKQYKRKITELNGRKEQDYKKTASFELQSTSLRHS